jgi:hypothetical protein
VEKPGVTRADTHELGPSDCSSQSTSHLLVLILCSLHLQVEPARELNKLFAPRRYGYLGTDVATSFRLPPSVRYGDYAWLLGDTFIGTSTPVVRNGGTDLVHNALAFLPAGHDVSPPDVRFFWNVREDGSPAEVFR